MDTTAWSWLSLAFLGPAPLRYRALNLSDGLSKRSLRRAMRLPTRRMTLWRLSLGTPGNNSTNSTVMEWWQPDLS